MFFQHQVTYVAQICTFEESLYQSILVNNILTRRVHNYTALRHRKEQLFVDASSRFRR